MEDASWPNGSGEQGFLQAILLKIWLAGSHSILGEGGVKPHTGFTGGEGLGILPRPVVHRPA